MADKIEALRALWCGWTHGGGRIERDPLGRINWRCAKCGRWSDNPVPIAEERRMTDEALAEYRASALIAQERG